MGRPKDRYSTDVIVQKRREYRLKRYYATKEQTLQALSRVHAEQIARLLQVKLTPETQTALEQYLLGNFKFKAKPLDK